MNPEPSLLGPIFTFNTWANESIRAAMEQAGEATVRQALDLWFGSVFAITAHIVAAEETWLARLRGSRSPAPASAAADFATLGDLLSAWRAADAGWQAEVAAMTPERLGEVVTQITSSGDALTFQCWQIVLHVAFHGAEHRAHAATGLTQLGVRHGPQDFHVQFMPPAVAALRWSQPPA